MATVEELQKRLAMLEEEILLLRRVVWKLTPNAESLYRVEKMDRESEREQEEGELTPIQRAEKYILESEREHDECVLAMRRVLKEMGIEGVEPVPAEQLQAMIEACGVRPEDNEFSRDIIRMREEQRPCDSST